MKSFSVPIAACLLLVSTIVIPKQKTFNGEIMDSHCAQLGTHGIVTHMKGARECTIDCVRFGAQYVLYDPSVQMAYGLDDQRKPEIFAGERVQVTGTIDRLANVIHVVDMRLAE